VDGTVEGNREALLVEAMGLGPEAELLDLGEFA